MCSLSIIYEIVSSLPLDQLVDQGDVIVVFQQQILIRHESMGHLGGAASTCIPKEHNLNMSKRKLYIIIVYRDSALVK